MDHKANVQFHWAYKFQFTNVDNIFKVFGQKPLILLCIKEIHLWLYVQTDYETLTQQNRSSPNYKYVYIEQWSKKSSVFFATFNKYYF